ncbi:MAG: prepilin-type N-terminal cleavage/methylation domain-containing protein [Candidatus Omnitrophica bacterium]|nr:prepilin-type N-terminal cleavage/methylation domain-containing protein [Candidatus Omnitrophota bacterium]
MQTLSNNFRGFTILELLTAVFIISIVSLALFQVFMVAQSAYAINLEKNYFQAYLRRVLELVVKDVRQTLAQNISANSPSSRYIKFSKILDYNPNLPANPFILDSNLTEYFYNSTTRTITRRLLDINGTELPGKVWIFSNITEDPFYIQDLNNDTLVVRIAGERIKRIGGREISLNLILEEKVKIRNH